MHLPTVISAICDSTGVPERPARGRGGAGNVGSVGLKEVVLVRRIMIDGAAQEGQENEQAGAGYENKGDQA